MNERIEVSPSFKKVRRTLREQTSDMRSWQLSMPSVSLEWRSQKATRLWVLKYRISSWFTSVEFSHSVMSGSLQPHGLQHSRLPCWSLTPRACSISCLLSQWCHPTVSSSVIPFSCLQSFPASGSLTMSQLFTSGGQIIGISASASVLPMNIQDWFPLGWTGWISLQSKGLSRVLSNTTVEKHQCYSKLT